MTTSNDACATDDVAIRVDHVSKRFRQYHRRRLGPVLERLFFWHSPSRYHREVRVLNDVSLSIRRGEVVGILGQNGAGKTTLLKLIAGMLSPDKGHITVNGRVTLLLALGIAAHPEFTGRESIVTTCLLLGMSRQEINRKMTSIIEFAELEAFIDHPFRTYSSGMQARLLFAAATSVEPDILIIDEALSTGDAVFVSKCEERIRAMCRQGATALFVSHSLNQIKSLCQRCLVVGRGGILFDGECNAAADHYVGEVEQIEDKRLDQENANRWSQANLNGSPGLAIVDAFFMSAEGRCCSLISGRAYDLHLVFQSPRIIPRARLQIVVRTGKAPVPYAVCPPTTDRLIQQQPVRRTFCIPNGRGEIIVSFGAMPMGDGRYSCDVLLYPADMNAEQLAALQPDEARQYLCEKAFTFQVNYEDKKFYGRGTLAEIPMRSVRVIGPPGRSAQVVFQEPSADGNTHCL